MITITIQIEPVTGQISVGKKWPTDIGSNRITTQLAAKIMKELTAAISLSDDEIEQCCMQLLSPKVAVVFENEEAKQQHVETALKKIMQSILENTNIK